jgi:uncharacterized membrane protein YeaQ/YmgE (transglycosylase-associated protein family)
MAIGGAVLLLLVLGAVALLFGLTFSLVYNLVIGLVVGALARLVLPGEEKIGLLGTALIGMAGGAGGHLLGRALHLGELLSFGISVALAAGLLTVLGFRAK